MTLTVAHYLKVYQLKKAMMDDSTVKPNAEGRELISRMATRLAELDPSLPCELSRATDSSNNCWYTFVVNDEEIARIMVGPDVH